MLQLEAGTIALQGRNLRVNNDDRILSESYFLNEGYIFPRQLDDGTWIGIIEEIYTFAICMDMNVSCYKKKYSYSDIAKCFVEYFKLHNNSQAPAAFVRSHIMFNHDGSQKKGF